VTWVDNVVGAFRDAGILQRQACDFGTLLDIAKGRGEFVRAIGRTEAWRELTAHPPADWPAVSWLQQHRVDATWMRAWLGDVKLRANTPSEIETVLFQDDICPHPGLDYLLDIAARRLDPAMLPKRQREWLEKAAPDERRAVFTRWLFGEQPPDVLHETRDEFMARMADAWDLRCIVTGRTERHRYKGDFAEYARWVVDHRIVGKTLQQIANEQPGPGRHRDTIGKAIAKFVDIIELPAPPRESSQTTSP
jgi:hypothetical protein